MTKHVAGPLTARSISSANADLNASPILARQAEGEATVTRWHTISDHRRGRSKHLKVLERADLITRGRSAQLRPSRLQAAPLAEAVAWLETYRRFWQGCFDRVG